MLEDGRTNAVAIVLQHLLCALERKGVMTKAETTAMLDEVIDDVVDLTTRGTLFRRSERRSTQDRRSSISPEEPAILQPTPCFATSLSLAAFAAARQSG